MYVTTWMELENIMLRLKKKDTQKSHLLCDFIYMKCPE